MAKLLSTDCFDSFLLEQAVIRMAATYSIDGQLNKDFYDGDVSDGESDPEHRLFTFLPWSEVRPLCREMIKGKKAPTLMKITLRLKPSYVEATLQRAADLQPGTLENVAGLLLNIRLDDTGLHLTTGIAARTFLMDKSPDCVWDRTMERFLASKDIDFIAQ